MLTMSTPSQKLGKKYNLAYIAVDEDTDQQCCDKSKRTSLAARQNGATLL